MKNEEQKKAVTDGERYSAFQAELKTLVDPIFELVQKSEDYTIMILTSVGKQPISTMVKGTRPNLSMLVNKAMCRNESVADAVTEAIGMEFYIAKKRDEFISDRLPELIKEVFDEEESDVDASEVTPNVP